MTWVGLIRNVMIGREGLRRDVLLSLLEDAGGTGGRSHLATGNVTFEAPERRIGAVVRRLEAGIESVIGRPEPVIVRDLEWLRDFAATDPFAGFDGDEWELLVAFLRLSDAPVAHGSIPNLGGTRILQAGEHEVVGVRPRTGRAPHVLVLTERATGLRATSRGWSTVVRLARA